MELDHREKGAGILLVTRCHPPEVLYPVEEALNLVALPADPRFVFRIVLAVGSRRDDVIDPVLRQALADRVAVIAFVQHG